MRIKSVPKSYYGIAIVGIVIFTGMLFVDLMVNKSAICLRWLLMILLCVVGLFIFYREDCLITIDQTGLKVNYHHVNYEKNWSHYKSVGILKGNNDLYLFLSSIELAEAVELVGKISTSPIKQKQYTVTPNLQNPNCLDMPIFILEMVPKSEEKKIFRDYHQILYYQKQYAELYRMDLIETKTDLQHNICKPFSPIKYVLAKAKNLVLRH